eukprot:3242606-Alexandrium_andersonii.AAC.1
MARVARRHKAAWWLATAAMSSPKSGVANAPVRRQRSAATRRAQRRAVAERGVRPLPVSMARTRPKGMQAGSEKGGRPPRSKVAAA